MLVVKFLMLIFLFINKYISVYFLQKVFSEMTCENDLIDLDTGEPESHPLFLVRLTAQEDCETGEHTKEIIKFKKSTFKVCIW